MTHKDTLHADMTWRQKNDIRVTPDPAKLSVRRIKAFLKIGSQRRKSNYH